MNDLYKIINDKLENWNKSEKLNRHGNGKLKLSVWHHFNRMLVKLNKTVPDLEPEDSEMEKIAFDVLDLLTDYLAQARKNPGPLYKEVVVLKKEIKIKLKEINNLGRFDKFSVKSDKDFKYGIFHSKNNAVGKPLFPNGGEPKYTDIVQRVTGDCYFVSVLSGLAKNNPGAIKACFPDYPKKNDKTEIDKFNNSKKVKVRLNKVKSKGRDVIPAGGTVTVVLDKSTIENAIFANKSALWVQLLEKAWAVYRKKGFDPCEGSLPKGSKVKTRILDSGRAKYAIAALTGKIAADDDIFWLGGSCISKKFIGFYSEEAENLFRKIQTAVESKRVVAASTARRFKNYNIFSYKKGLCSHHAYTVIGTKEEGNIKYIIIRNPHALQSRIYVTGKYGRKHSKSKMHKQIEQKGVSEIELNDFCNYFFNVTFEKESKTEEELF